MVLTTMVAGLLMTASGIDKWELKPGIEPKAKAAWAIQVDVDSPDGGHQAEFTMVREIGDADGANHKATCAWSKLLVDGGEVGEDPTWDVSFGPRGALVGTTDMMGDDIRRMLSPMTFVYPEGAVGDGDKWTAEVRPFKGKDDLLLTYAYEVKGVEKVDGADALRVAATLTEKGQDAMSAEGTWWVGKDGGVLKFQMKVTNWVVPMAGGDLMNATMTGKTAK
ncbi:MAG: hypothetical protein M9921_01780 [Fimbriimonadaceae bacterium]|nr:hypothetical protein [Chthonomonadaceae bacterium]MCO5295566.1 hypothetical protein [Fimbriimonadaceae bacterium]